MENEKLITAENELRLAFVYEEYWRLADAVRLIYEAAKEDALIEFQRIINDVPDSIKLDNTTQEGLILSRTIDHKEDECSTES